MSEGTPSTSSSVEDENEKNCAVTPRITGAFTPAWPKGWNTRPGVLRSSSCRRVTPAASSCSPSCTDTLAGTLSSGWACLFTVTVTSGSVGGASSVAWAKG